MDRPSRIRIGCTLVASVVILSACGGSSESQCAAPTLVVSPQELKPGELLTVTWQGALSCEEDPVPTSLRFDIAIAEPPSSIAQDTPPNIVVQNWAEVAVATSQPAGKPTEEPLTLTEAIPTDLPPGDYIVAVSGADVIRSQPFTVAAG